MPKKKSFSHGSRPGHHIQSANLVNVMKNWFRRWSKWRWHANRFVETEGKTVPLIFLFSRIQSQPSSEICDPIYRKRRNQFQLSCVATSPRRRRVKLLTRYWRLVVWRWRRHSCRQFCCRCSCGWHPNPMMSFASLYRCQFSTLHSR